MTPAGVPAPYRPWVQRLGSEGISRRIQRQIVIWVVCILAFFVIGHWSLFCAINVVGSVLAVRWTLKLIQRGTRRREHARLLADCEYQHAAWRRGDDAIAFFGRFQPAGIDGKIVWCAPPQAFADTPRSNAWKDWGEDEGGQSPIGDTFNALLACFTDMTPQRARSDVRIDGVGVSGQEAIEMGWTC